MSIVIIKIVIFSTRRCVDILFGACLELILRYFSSTIFKEDEIIVEQFFKQIVTLRAGNKQRGSLVKLEIRGRRIIKVLLIAHNCYGTIPVFFTVPIYFKLYPRNICNVACVFIFNNNLII